MTTPQNMEAGLNKAISDGVLHGAHVCASNSSGSFTYQKMLGSRTLLSGEKKPLQVDDVVLLASGTKLIAAIAALQCVEEGQLSLTGDLYKLAPELATKKVLTGFADDGTPQLEDQKQPITLEMLLTHSAGLSYYFIDPVINRWREANGIKKDPNGARTHRVEHLFQEPLAFQPGQSWAYGGGLDWAGRIVERVTGQTLLDRVKERILAPIGAPLDAEFCPVTRPDLRDRMVDLNPEDPEGLGAAVFGGSGDTNRGTLGAFGGHSLFMSAESYIAVLRSLLRNDGKILKPATVDTMFSDHLSSEAHAGMQKAFAGPMGPFYLVGTDPARKNGYGLSGLLTQEDVDGWYGAQTLTWGGGLTLVWFIDRTNDLCGLAALQAAIPVNVDAIQELKQVFRKGIYKEYAAWKEQQVKHSL